MNRLNSLVYSVSGIYNSNYPSLTVFKPRIGDVPLSAATILTLGKSTSLPTLTSCCLASVIELNIGIFHLWLIPTCYFISPLVFRNVAHRDNDKHRFIPSYPESTFLFLNLNPCSGASYYNVPFPESLLIQVIHRSYIVPIQAIIIPELTDSGELVQHKSSHF